MKWLLILWGGPVTLLTGWYGLSYYDMSFGIFMLTREAHDLVFRVYGHILGMPPETIPPLVARAMIIDSLIVFGLVAMRKRRQITARYRRHYGASRSPEAPLASNANLSSAP
ncbi:hypothetical protein GOD03_20410 [Sinorhizobium medicae]|uniref:DUF6105 family protein n=1 Tax=Sinorhizobium medicae TaxID=110321 RepID=UPI000FE04F1D|nr:DUF6105 family protein [Sinorhizobium medicae]MDX0702600.1 hypothetical protein [Sinorhizobium medicae]RVJ14343.1 hypothetical protein CN183_03145 [Sinorhizobium medicae]